MIIKNYNIELDFDLEKSVYQGREKIFLNLDNEDSIKIDSVDLEIKELKVNDNKADFEISDDKILIKNGFKSGENIIFISFEGKLREVLGGIYLSKYRDEGEKYLITTQFEPIEARKAFPCFDDPNKKATFDLILTIPKNFQAISNTLPIKEEIVGEKKKVIFETSPKMSTYLLYIGVGDFYFLEDKYRDVILRVAVVAKEKLEGARFALENCKRFLNYLEEYFSISYPLKKLDLIAIPDFAAGAMENWGAITFRENLLLAFKGITSQSAKERICEVIAHELVHMWFGNLVTMNWWDDLWLNESFATYLAYKVVNNFYPEWRILDKYVIDEVFSALNADALISSHPIKVEIKDPEESVEIFDEISYEKGGSVLRMIENYLGEEKFRDGLRDYIKKFEYKNAQAEDLWNSLEGISQIKVKEIMKDYLEKVCFPEVDIKNENENYLLKQKKFLFLAEDTSVFWKIPMVISVNDKEIKMVFDKEITNLSISSFASHFPPLLILNKNYSSFFISNYDVETLKNNLENLEKLSEMDQIHLLHDYEFLVRKGEKKLNDFCEILGRYFFKLEGRLLFGEIISYLNFYFYFTENLINEKVKNLLEKFSLKTLEILSKEAKGEEMPYESILRSKAIYSLGLTQNKEILHWSQEKFEEFLKNKGSLHPDIKQVVFNNVVLANEKYVENLVSYFQESNLIEEQNKCLVALGNLQNMDKLKDIFDFILSDKVRFNQIIFFLSALSTNLKAKKIAFEFLKNYWTKLEEKGGGQGKSDFILIKILKSTIPFLGAFAYEEELESFLNQENFQRFEKTKKVVLEKSKINRLVLIRSQQD